MNSKREWVEKHFDLQNIKEQLPAFGKFGFRSVFMIGSGRVRASMLGYCLPQSCNSVLKRPKVFCLCLRPDLLGRTVFMLEHSLFQVLDLPGTGAQKPQIQADAEAMKKREFIETPNFCLFVFFLWVSVSWRCFIQCHELKGLRDGPGTS